MSWKIISKEHFLFYNKYSNPTLCTWNSEISFMCKWRSFSRKKLTVIQKFWKLHSVAMFARNLSKELRHLHQSPPKSSWKHTYFKLVSRNNFQARFGLIGSMSLLGNIFDVEYRVRVEKSYNYFTVFVWFIYTHPVFFTILLKS